MKKYNVGLVGVRRGGSIIRTVNKHPQCEIKAMCDINPESLEEQGKQYGLPESRLFENYEEFIESDLDVVVLATPIEFHAQQSIMAMEAGKHVLCEQVAAYSIEDCQRIIDAAKRTGKTYMMAENYTFFHCILEWKKMIEAGKLGKIYHAEGEYIHEIVDRLVDPETGEKKWRYPRAPILYCGHSLGPLLFLMQDRVVKATGVTSGWNMYPDYQDTPSFLDMETGLFLTEKGSVIKILGSQTVKRYQKDRPRYLTWYSLYGTKGFVESGRDQHANGLEWLEDVDSKQDGARKVLTPFANPDAPPEAGVSNHGTGEYYMFRHFIEALDRGTRPVFDAVQAAEVTAAGIMAHKSAMKGGEWLHVPQFGW